MASSPAARSWTMHLIVGDRVVQSVGGGRIGLHRLNT